jgi:serine phosphatase RsbU (regulator of sigma subunit)
MDSQPARVAIVSEQAIFLRGLVSIILTLQETSLVGEAHSRVEAIQLCQLTAPDILLLDLKNGLDHWRETIQLLHERFPELKFVLFHEPIEDNQLQEAFPNIPHTYFCRDMTEEEFRVSLVQLWHGTGVLAGLSQTVTENFEDDEEELRNLVRRIQLTPAPRNQDTLTRELGLAGKLQNDILPEEPPVIHGWEIVARLEPARETSGDFYDFIPLTDRKMGVVVADVADKGMGAALFMALSSTLIRTYAARFPTLPALTMNAVSERLLTDTRSSMFVTTLYGILEPYTGRFVFANAGHPPGFLIRTRRGYENIEPLRPTGMALGVSEKAQWKQKMVKFMPGDFMILYTDGITEAQNPDGKFFGEDRLIDIAFSKKGCNAAEICSALLKDVHRFVGNAPRQDDIALIVIRRISD